MQNKDQSHQNSTIKNQFEDLTDSLVIDPSLIWFVLLKYKKILLLVPIVIACIVYFFTKSLIPTYQSNASLIYNNDSSNIVEISEVYDQASNNNQNEINTQISVLKSREILKRILTKSEKISEINNLNTPNKENFISKTLSLIGVNFFAPKKINQEALFSQLFGSMSVSQTRNSNVINITLEANVPEQAKKALDLILATYLEYDIDQKISVTSYASDKINERLNELKVKLEDSEKILQVYKEKNKLIDLGDIKNLKSDEIQSISKRIIKAETQLQELQNNLQQISIAGEDLEQLISLKFLRDIKEIQTIKSNLDSNQSTIDSLKLVYKDSHPKVTKAIKTKDNLMNDLKEIIDENIAVNAYELASLESFIRLSNDELEIARAELQDLENKDLEMQKYVRDVSLNERIYQIFLERLKETNQAKELQTSNAKILNYPNLPSSPIKPNPKKNALIGWILIFGGLFSLAFYYEIFKRTISNPEILERNNFDTLNVIPKIEKKIRYSVPLDYLDDKKGKFAESIKMMQVIAIAKYPDTKVFLISSPVAEEGKTTISLNFAISLAERFKVVYLEADLRRPSLKKAYGIKDKPGLIDIFVNNQKFSEAILNLPNSNLDIVTAGNPGDLKTFPERRFKKLIEVLKEHYDYIVIDTAPILPVADTLTIASEADTVLLVARSDFTKFSGLLNASKKIQSVSKCDIAAVINYFDTNQLNYYNYSRYGSYYKSYYNYSTS
jgi:succinoglycan biosynthesis transport protein ExoP